MKPVAEGLDFAIEAKIHFLQDLNLRTGTTISSLAIGCGQNLKISDFRSKHRDLDMFPADKYAKKLLTAG